MTDISFGHGGNVHKHLRDHEGQKVVDFSANINPLGPPSWLRSTISSTVSSLLHYPDPDSYNFTQAISAHYGIAKDKVVVANGTTELLYLLPRVIPAKRAVIPVPSYIDYEKVIELNRIEKVLFPLNEEDNFSLDLHKLQEALLPGDLVIIGSPNNPTGTTISFQHLVDLCLNNPEVLFVIDEAFLDFLDDARSVCDQSGNIITLNSLTKFYALPGLRLGFGTFPREIAKKIKEYLPPWSVNSLAQVVGEKLFQDLTYREKSLSEISCLRKNLEKQLKSFADLKVFPSKVNYLFIKITNQISAEVVAEKLLKKGIAIRVCANYVGLDSSYFRIAVRTERENKLLVEGLSTIFSKKTGVSKKSLRIARALMIQGTSSNAGKSVLVAAICRILIQDGVRVAPFKAQNMSLNSYVTHDGLEMGRAQVVQAQASRLDPDVHMNPVLLKPNSDMGSQIIVHGKPVGNMNVSEYVRYKPEAWNKVKQSFNYLRQDYDAVILEGAGSPGEVNLKHHDIVNMKMAKHADSPVLLVGDIDRGGVYASFIGTMEVLDEWERELIAGFLVNRFRGDSTLLQPAHDFLLESTHKPVFGTIPHIHNLGIPEEDSVSFKNGQLQKRRPAHDHIEIALINLPHISNFTDIEPFLDEPDVYLSIINTADELKKPDAIIIPGSKNVFADVDFLLNSGLGAEIVKKLELGVEVVGICGGYQMLGRSIKDPLSIESQAGELSGLGLLDIETELAKDKTLIRQQGVHILSSLPVTGYEIHHGLSVGSSDPALRFQSGEFCGASHPRLPVWGAYLHGIFDSDHFRRWFIDNIRENKGLTRKESILAPYNLEESFDRLADIVRNSIDLDRFYSTLGV